MRITRKQLEVDDTGGEKGLENDSIIDADERSGPMTSDEESGTSEEENEANGDSDYESSPQRISVSGADGNQGNKATEQETDELSATLKRTREGERKKGKAVARQLVSKPLTSYERARS